MYDHLGLFTMLESALKDRPNRTLTSLAAEFGVGRHTLETIIAEKTGGTFKDFKGLQLVRSSNRHLAEPNVSIKEIASRVGYASARSLTRALKRNLAEAPSQVRRSHRRALSGGRDKGNRS